MLRAGYKTEASMKDLQHKINKLVAWGGTCNLKFNPDKTVVIIFHKQGIHPNNYPPQLNINDKTVPFSNSVKYLGVTLDNKLDWDIHQNNIIKTAKKNLILLGNVIARPWGPRPILSRWMYTGIIRPKLSHASIAWAHTLQTAKVKQLMITPIRKSVATKSLEVIYNV